MPKAQIRKIGAKIKEIKVKTMGITTYKSIMFEGETTTTKITSTGVTMVVETIKVGPMFHLKIKNLLIGMVEIVWNELKICCKR